MHPWGIHTFEDEIARDWIEDLNDSDPVVFLAHCLELGDTNDLNYLACVGVLCTAELIHASYAPQSRPYPDAVKLWMTEHQDLDFKSLTLRAIAALRQILNPHSDFGLRSELLERWMDHEKLGTEWLEDKQNLLRLLEDDFSHSTFGNAS